MESMDCEDQQQQPTIGQPSLGLATPPPGLLHPHPPVTPPVGQDHQFAVPAPPTTGDSIYGRLACFEIEKKIGRGQFSVVYRARCKANSAIVALKKVQVSTYPV